MMAAIDGIELSWSEAGEGGPLVWLHGFTGCGADWKYVFDDAPAGFRLIAPDLPGHGGSTGRPGPYSFRASAVDVLALLDHLGIARVSIVGLSGGGITALHVATLQPDRVQRMICVSAPSTFPPQARALQRNYSPALLGDAELARLRRCHPREGQVDALVAQTRAFADATDPDFTPADLAKIGADTLLVFGDRDPLYPVSIATEMHAAIPRSWLWVVPNGGHSPVFGPMASRFRETAIEFLGGKWC